MGKDEHRKFAKPTAPATKIKRVAPKKTKKEKGRSKASTAYVMPVPKIRFMTREEFRNRPFTKGLIHYMIEIEGETPEEWAKRRISWSKGVRRTGKPEPLGQPSKEDSSEDESSSDEEDSESSSEDGGHSSDDDDDIAPKKFVHEAAGMARIQCAN